MVYRFVNNMFGFVRITMYYVRELRMFAIVCCTASLGRVYMDVIEVGVFGIKYWRDKVAFRVIVAVPTRTIRVQREVRQIHERFKRSLSWSDELYSHSVRIV